MSDLIRSKNWLALGAATILLAGCASTPAPVVNHSFGGSGGTEATSAQASPSAAPGGAQTFGLGGHVNGTVTPAGYTVARGDTLYSIAFAHGMDVRELAALNAIAPPYVIHPGQVLKLKPAGAEVAAVSAPVAPPPAEPAAPPPSHPVAPPPPAGPVFGPVTTQTMTPQGVAPATSASTSASASETPSAPLTSAISKPPVAAPATAVGSAPPPTVIEPAPAVASAATPTPPPGATRNVAGIAWRWPSGGKVISGFQSGQGGDGAGLDIAGNLGDPVRAAADGTVVYSGNGLIGYGELIIIKHNETYLSAYGHNSKRLVKEGQHVSAGQEIALMGASGAPRVELHFEIRKDGKPVDPMGYLPGR